MVGNIARVVVALEAAELVEEVMQFLDRSGRVQVVATAADDRQLSEAIRQLEPDAIVAEPSLVDPDIPTGSVVLALAMRETPTVLRAAISVGSRGFYLWPGDRDALADAVTAAAAPVIAPDRQATVVAVHGARGGVGSTFVATHLAAACARRASSTLLIDADPVYGDLSVALGAPADGVHTLGDLLPLVDELTTAHLQEVLWRHPDGFGVLLAPPPETGPLVQEGDLRVMIEMAGASRDVVILHLGRALDGCCRAAMAMADRLLEVLSLDVLSLRATARALAITGPGEDPSKVGFIVNRAAKGRIVIGDVVRVFGVEPLAVLPTDRSVAVAQDEGRLLPPRGRMGRAFDRLASAILADQAHGEQPAAEPRASA